MFHVIQDAYCIVRGKRGVYKQCKVYKYKGGLYIGACGGFVRLMKEGNVGTPDLTYVELHVPDVDIVNDSLGRLTVGSAS